MDRMDPRRTGIGYDNAGGAKDGKPADDAKPRVPGFFGESHAVFNGNRHLDILSAPVRPARFGNIVDNHPARRRIDGWFTDLKRKTGQRHRADAVARPECYTAAGCGKPHNNLDQRAMGDIGVIAGILDDRRPRLTVLKRRSSQVKAGAFTLGKNNLDGIWKPPCHQPAIGRPRRRRRTGAGGPAEFKPAVFAWRNIKCFGHGRFVIPKGACLLDRLSHGRHKTTT